MHIFYSICVGGANLTYVGLGVHFGMKGRIQIMNYETRLGVGLRWSSAGSCYGVIPYQLEILKFAYMSYNISLLIIVASTLIHVENR